MSDTCLRGTDQRCCVVSILRVEKSGKVRDSYKEPTENIAVNAPKEKAKQTKSKIKKEKKEGSSKLED